MTDWRLLFSGLKYHWRIHVAVSLGVASATAVLTGALLVGDSVRGSLRHLTLDRLGKIDQVLVQDRFFRADLAQELAAAPGFQRVADTAIPAILFPHGTVEHPAVNQTTRAASVLVVGCDDRFWGLDNANIRPERHPGENELVLNEPLAHELGVKVGDTVTLRLPQSNQVPADSPLASKNDRVRGVPNLTVVAVIPAQGLGRFNLQPSQQVPRNAYVSLGTLQSALDKPGTINAIFVSSPHAPNTIERPLELSSLLQPTLADFGIVVKQVRHGFRRANEAEQIGVAYSSVSSDRMIFSSTAADVIQHAVKPQGGQPVLTYLANSIRRSPRDGESDDHPGIPYSMVSAIDASPSFALTDLTGKPIGALKDDEVVLNEWAASDLEAQPGDRIQLSYFEPETTHGQAVERTAEFTLKAIAALTKPVQPTRRNRPAQYDQPLTPANDPDLTPEVEGVTDQETISRWDAPFPFDQRRVRDTDDEYWQNYRTTPKAFVAYSAGLRLWGSRFGEVTSFRVPDPPDLDSLTRTLDTALTAHATALGFQFIPIKARQLAASRGTTPFDVLFLSLSFFVIAAALMMVTLLFRLGIEQRSPELGVLLAVGMRRRRVGRLLVTEGLIVAAAGAALGVAIGIGYAQLILWGLSHWWLGAITTPFLRFYSSPLSLVIGYGLGVIFSVVTIAWTVRQTKKVSVRRLLSGQVVDDIPSPTVRRASRWPVVWVGLAVVLSGLALALGGMAQAGAFVGGGAALLIGALLWIRGRLRRHGTSSADPWTHRGVLWQLATRNAARNPGRSVITIGLMAFATFLIVAMSSFRLAPTDRGAGGFQLLAESSQPIYADLNSDETRYEYFGTQQELLHGTTVLGMRRRDGDDASCNNLYQATQPRVLGITSRLVEYFDRPDVVSFTWAGSAASTAEQKANPWRLLAATERDADKPIPAVLDKNTAMYSLHLYRGIGEQFEFNYDGQLVRFQVVGLLENSVLQGSLLIGESDFQRSFPDVSGYRYFLIAAPPARATHVARLLEDRLSDEGFDAIATRDVLEQFLAVQNTYLSTFQSLGALGLLLGTFGLATVQLRNVLERRGELALLRATGYKRLRIAKLVLLENFALLIAGLATGALAALLAVLPHKLLGEAAFSWSLLRDLAIMLGAVLLAGLLSSLISVRAVSRMPLLASLRGE